MKAEIFKSIANGVLNAPPSKSLAHRAIICAALADNTSIIDNITYSEDINATIEAVKSIGAEVEKKNNKLIIKGTNGIINNCEFSCNESGSTLRFMIPICLLNDKTSILTGKEKLLSRPLSIFEDICKSQNLFFEKDLTSLKIKGKIKPGNFVLKGDISSQFFTGLLFSLPLLDTDSTIQIIPPLESKSYINITIDILKKFGVDIHFEDLTIKIKGNQKFKSINYTVEGDYSNSAYLDAFNYGNGNIKLVGLGETRQGDKVYKEIFNKLKNDYSSIDIADCPDLAPILIAVACVNNGTILYNTKRLKIKESDRGQAMADELKKFGINIINNENEIIVPKSKIIKPIEILDSHNDHRIAMALTFLASLTGGIINDAQAINKSFPNFFEKIRKVGIKVNTYV